MKSKYFSSGAAALALGAALWVAPGKVQGQGPLYDRVNVNLPYTVTIGDKVLQPGEYVIQQLNSASGDSRVLLIYGDNGMKFETSAMTIPCLDTNTARDTRVMLHHFGNDYYFDKVWIQGKDYGYEFPLTQDARSRESERGVAVTVAAKYENTTREDTATAPEQSAATAESAELHQPVTTEQVSQPATSQTSAGVQDPEAQIPASPEAATPPYAPSRENGEIAQAPPPASQPPAHAASDDLPTATTETPATETESRNREMPRTASNWLTMLLTGCLLAAAGIALRRAVA